jgi:hypothetical protein
MQQQQPPPQATLPTKPAATTTVECKLLDNEKTVLSYLTRNGWCTSNTVFGFCSIDENAGTSALTALEKAKLIERRIQGERFLWQATAKGKAMISGSPAPNTADKDTTAAAAGSSSRPGKKSDAAVAAMQRQQQRRQNREQVIKQVQDQPNQSAEDISAALGLERSIVNGVLYSLYQEYKVDKTGDFPPLWFVC